MSVQRGAFEHRLHVGLCLCLIVLAGLALPAAAASLDVSVSTSAGAPVEDAAIVVEGSARPLAAARIRQAEWIEQLDREFLPYLTIVQKGASIDFPNHDPIKHHVYSFSPAKVFEIKLYAGKPASPVVFDKVGEVVLGCNIHDWMIAHVLVVDTPWFAKTQKDGMTRIERIPDGKYKVRVWHPRQKVAIPERELTLGPGTTKLKFSLEVLPRPAIPKPKADSDSY